MQRFLSRVGGLGSLQFIVTVEAAAVGGAGLEAGISIDVRQILYFLSHGFEWDPSFTQLLSFHVGYALDIGPQGGVDVGLCIGYHTSRVTEVNGFGWGFSIEAGAGYSGGISVGWPLPGTHIPNQFVVQIIGLGATAEAAAFWNHNIIVGYYDTQLGFMLAAPSVNAARFSGTPSLYYSKYTWTELGHRFYGASPQVYWARLGWNENMWEMNDCNGYVCQAPDSDGEEWVDLTDFQRENAGNLGYDERTWNAPTASHGYYFLDPLGYFAPYAWVSMLEFETELFTCLGWDEHMWESSNGFPIIWDASWDGIGFERQACAVALGYDRVHWDGKHHHSAYEMGDFNAAGCPLGEVVTSHEECVGATNMIGLRFIRQAQFVGWPSKCFCIPNYGCYWNLRNSGQGNIIGKPLCETGHVNDEFLYVGQGFCANAQGHGFSSLAFRNVEALDTCKLTCETALAANRNLVGLEYNARFNICRCRFDGIVSCTNAVPDGSLSGDHCWNPPNDFTGPVTHTRSTHPFVWVCYKKNE
jgi:hypothetical protein